MRWTDFHKVSKRTYAYISLTLSTEEKSRTYECCNSNSNKLTNQMQQFHKFIYYLTFMCRSTCFGRLHAHHQEITTSLTASGFTLARGGSSVVGRGLAGYNRTDHDQQRC
jgi:hypothetical protein